MMAVEMGPLGYNYFKKTDNNPFRQFHVRSVHSAESRLFPYMVTFKLGLALGK